MPAAERESVAKLRRRLYERRRTSHLFGLLCFTVLLAILSVCSGFTAFHTDNGALRPKDLMGFVVVALLFWWLAYQLVQGLRQEPREMRAARFRRCVHCGYPLTATDAKVCPECGKDPNGIGAL